MKWFYNMKINRRLMMGFIITALLAMAVGLMGGLDVTSRNSFAVSELVIVLFIVVMIIAVIIGRVTSQSINVPVRKLTEVAYRLAKGNINVNVEVTSNDELGELMHTFSEMVDNIKRQAQIATQIAAGTINMQVQTMSSEDILTNSLVDVINTLQNLMSEMNYMSSQHDAGDIDIMINESKFQGAYREVAKGVNNMVNGHITVKKKAMATVAAFAQGNFEAELDRFPGKKAFINDNIEFLRKNLKEVSVEVNKLIVASQQGQLSQRANVQAFNGDWAGVMSGLNNLLDTILQPVQEAANVLREVSKGNLSVSVKGDYKGDHALIKDSLNETLTSLNELMDGINYMSLQHDAGDIDVLVNENKFQGSYRILAKSINDMVNGHITVKKKAMACVAEFAKGNFDAELEKFPGKKAFINDNLENLRSNLKEVNTEISLLISASNAGKLSERADEQRFTGDWAVLMHGLNGLIDAILQPIQEASAVLEEMAKGNLQVMVKGNYQGDHAKIKNALNDTVTTLSMYVKEISVTLTEMAKGNLRLALTSDYRGDFSTIKTSLNEIIRSLNNVLNDIHNTASQVASGARQVSDSAQALSQGSTEQASSVEQLTASMEEISAQTKQNSLSANQASELAMSAKNGAIEGNKQMKGMLSAMGEINESSSNISKIIKVIDEIAFQTNILALNAAVEAARAGQHGKGFAVVAEEVRNLAARSANAAKETTGLIESSIKKVEDGSRIAQETANALNTIVDSVTTATNLVGEIAKASNEQALGISQVNQGIIQVSQVVQMNSATSEESAAASEELSSQAEILKEMVGKFQLKQAESTNRGHEEISPEIMEILENMRASRVQADVMESKPLGAARSLVAAAHSDFGKY